jgi:glycosyltransferase involved in cell wall biosynthesis
MSPDGRPLYVEASPLLSPRLTGIGRFPARLVESLARRTAVRLVTLLARHEARQCGLRTSLARGEEIAVDAQRLPGADLDLDGWVGHLLRLPKVAHDLERSRRCGGVYTQTRPAGRHFARELSILYDFTPVLLPAAHEPWARHEFGVFFSRGLAASDKVIAISSATKADSRWLTPLAEDDVVVASPGPSVCAFAHASGAPIERHPARFLVVATHEPRKNAAFVLDWFEDTSLLPEDAELYWAGPEGWLTNRSRRRAGARRSRRKVRLLGMVSDARLCELYRSATASIYPSLYEGFGFPVLDSLLHGTPVVCSYNSALEEFEGPGVFYCDPHEPASLEAAMRDLLSARNPIARPDLHQRCSWDRMAEVVLDLCG